MNLTRHTFSLLLLCATCLPFAACTSEVDVESEEADTTESPDTYSAPLSAKQAIEVYWRRGEGGTYQLRALTGGNIRRVEYLVDGYTVGNVLRDGTTGNFPTQYTFDLSKNERFFEARGYDAQGNFVARGIGLMDVTEGVGVYIKQMGDALFEIGLERAPDAVDTLQVTVDDKWVLTDSVTKDTQSTRLAVRSTFSGVGPRTFKLTTFNADGSIRGNLYRSFDLSGGTKDQGTQPDEPSVACSGVPKINSRASWGARAYRGGTSTLGAPTRITIHHEGAGVRRALSTNGAVAMRNVQNFHQNSNGWSDVGYHYVIMPDGQIYEGRSAHRNGGLALGSHAYRANSNNIGVMLFGDFSLQEPTSRQLTSASHLVAHLARTYRIDVRVDRTLFGHRDFGGTSCPGANLYSKLDNIAAAANQCR